MISRTQGASCIIWRNETKTKSVACLFMFGGIVLEVSPKMIR